MTSDRQGKGLAVHSVQCAARGEYSLSQSMTSQECLKYIVMDKARVQLQVVNSKERIQSQLEHDQAMGIVYQYINLIVGSVQSHLEQFTYYEHIINMSIKQICLSCKPRSFRNVRLLIVQQGHGQTQLSGPSGLAGMAFLNPRTTLLQAPLVPSIPWGLLDPFYWTIYLRTSTRLKPTPIMSENHQPPKYFFLSPIILELIPSVCVTKNNTLEVQNLVFLLLKLQFNYQWLSTLFSTLLKSMKIQNNRIVSRGKITEITKANLFWKKRKSSQYVRQYNPFGLNKPMSPLLLWFNYGMLCINRYF